MLFFYFHLSSSKFGFKLIPTRLQYRRGRVGPKRLHIFHTTIGIVICVSYFIYVGIEPRIFIFKGFIIIFHYCSVELSSINRWIFGGHYFSHIVFVYLLTRKHSFSNRSSKYVFTMKGFDRTSGLIGSIFCFINLPHLLPFSTT